MTLGIKDIWEASQRRSWKCKGKYQI